LILQQSLFVVFSTMEGDSTDDTYLRLVINWF